MTGRRRSGGFRPSAREVVIVAALLVAMAYVRREYDATPGVAALVVTGAVCALYLVWRIGRRILHVGRRR